jgi:hypothetical protein
MYQIDDEQYDLPAFTLYRFPCSSNDRSRRPGGPSRIVSLLADMNMLLCRAYLTGLHGMGINIRLFIF